MRAHARMHIPLMPFRLRRFLRSRPSLHGRQTYLFEELHTCVRPLLINDSDIFAQRAAIRIRARDASLKYYTIQLPPSLLAASFNSADFFFCAYFG